jgi:hypothetical protein
LASCPNTVETINRKNEAKNVNFMVLGVFKFKK